MKDFHLRWQIKFYVIVVRRPGCFLWTLLYIFVFIYTQISLSKFSLLFASEQRGLM